MKSKVRIIHQACGHHLIATVKIQLDGSCDYMIGQAYWCSTCQANTEIIKVVAP